MLKWLGLMSASASVAYGVEWGYWRLRAWLKNKLHPGPESDPWFPWDEEND